MVSKVFLVSYFVLIGFSFASRVSVVACRRCMFVGVKRYCSFVYCLFRQACTHPDTTINDELYVFLVSSTMRTRYQQVKVKEKSKKKHKSLSFLVASTSSPNMMSTCPHVQGMRKRKVSHWSLSGLHIYAVSFKFHVSSNSSSTFEERKTNSPQGSHLPLPSSILIFSFTT